MGPSRETVLAGCASGHAGWRTQRIFGKWIVWVPFREHFVQVDVDGSPGFIARNFANHRFRAVVVIAPAEKASQQQTCQRDVWTFSRHNHFHRVRRTARLTASDHTDLQTEVRLAVVSCTGHLQQTVCMTSSISARTSVCRLLRSRSTAEQHSQHRSRPACSRDYRPEKSRQARSHGFRGR